LPRIGKRPASLGLLCLALLTGLAWQPRARAEWFSRQAAIMGTRVGVELWHDQAGPARAAMDAVLAEFRRLDQALSPFIEESELARVNREAASHPVAVSAELFGLLEQSRHFSELTHGAFDITFASVGYLYDYRQGRRPTDAQIAARLPNIDYRQVELDPHTRQVHFGRPGVRIDLGGIAKGYAVDRAIALLQERGIKHALVSAGGDSRIIGDHEGRPWHIGIRAPRDPQGMVAVLPLTDTAISTSGDYERYFEADGVRYHHILNPRTGRSAREERSVTILGPNATETDALSTSVFVLGTQAGLALVERLPEIEAVIIDSQGRMHYSDGLRAIHKRP